MNWPCRGTPICLMVKPTELCAGTSFCWANAAGASTLLARTREETRVRKVMKKLRKSK
ncbi:hypothetical protein D3C78_1894310 [compost metagenome]